MDKQQIYQDLSRLLDEIDTMPMDDAERRRLHGIVRELESHIEEPEPVERHNELVDTVDDLISRFETEHPSATGVLRRVLNALSSMGV